MSLEPDSVVIKKENYTTNIDVKVLNISKLNPVIHENDSMS